MSDEGTTPIAGAERERSHWHEVRRFVLFLGVILAIWTAMHVYVAAHLVPETAAGSIVVIGLLVSLWALFPTVRIVARVTGVRMPAALELGSGLWLGYLFQLVIWLAVADVVTGFGHLLPDAVGTARAIAVGLATTLGLASLVQGMRAPRVIEREVALRGLPAELDGSTLVHLSDLHLGTLLGPAWASRLAADVRRLAPDLIALTGDIIDASPDEARELIPALGELDAPLGVWAVTGNHEFYMGLEGSLASLRAAGARVLRDEWRELARGLVIAGVDDLTARRQLGGNGDAIARALDGRPEGATILLSHSPLEVEAAARRGAGLMLSGHTHGGQIWPFGVFVRLFYRYLGGLYRIGDMTLVVSRGTGTWGPRMRLPGRAEIILLRLRAAAT